MQKSSLREEYSFENKPKFSCSAHHKKFNIVYRPTEVNQFANILLKSLTIKILRKRSSLGRCLVKTFVNDLESFQIGFYNYKE